MSTREASGFDHCFSPLTPFFQLLLLTQTLPTSRSVRTSYFRNSPNNSGPVTQSYWKRGVKEIKKRHASLGERKFGTCVSFQTGPVIFCTELEESWKPRKKHQKHAGAKKIRKHAEHLNESCTKLVEVWEFQKKNIEIRTINVHLFF